MEQKIGIIGGMGPMASQLFYKLVTDHTAADCDQDHLNMVILSDTAMPDRTAAILSGKIQPVRQQLLQDAQLLEQCGCSAIGITCNTAHYFANLIQGELHIPILHMINETVNAIAKAAPGSKVALLATDGTIKTGIYQEPMEAAGLHPYILPPEMQKNVMYQIYDRIKSGKPRDDEKWRQLDAHLKAAGCDCAVLGCTELSVIKADNCLDSFYIDPLEVLARKVITFAGKEVKE